MKTYALMGFVAFSAAVAGAGAAYFGIAQTQKAEAAAIRQVAAVEQTKKVPVPCPVWFFQQIAGVVKASASQ